MNFTLEAQDKYNSLKETIRQKWSRLTKHDLDVIGDSKDKLAAKIASLYGYTTEEVMDEINKLWAEEIYNEEDIYNEEGVDNEDEYDGGEKYKVEI